MEMHHRRRRDDNQKTIAGTKIRWIGCRPSAGCTTQGAERRGK
jgi:hypothetical protein